MMQGYLTLRYLTSQTINEVPLLFKSPTTIHYILLDDYRDHFPQQFFVYGLHFGSRVDSVQS